MINVYEICLNTIKLSDIQYARFQILPVDLYFGLFLSAGIPTLYSSNSKPARVVVSNVPYLIED